MGRNKGYTADEVIKAMKGTGGILSVVSDKLGCSSKTVHNYIKEYPTIKEAWIGERLRLRAMAEVTIMQQMKNGNYKAAIFVLNQLDPETGEFTPPTVRNEISGRDGGDIVIKAVDYRNGLAAIATGDDGFTDSEK